MEQELECAQFELVDSFAQLLTSSSMNQPGVKGTVVSVCFSNTS